MGSPDHAERFQEVQGGVLQRDPRVRVVLSDSASSAKFGFVQIDVRSPVAKALRQIERSLPALAAQRRKFFRSGESSAEALSRAQKWGGPLTQARSSCAGASGSRSWSCPAKGAAP